MEDLKGTGKKKKEKERSEGAIENPELSLLVSCCSFPPSSSLPSCLHSLPSPSPPLSLFLPSLSCSLFPLSFPFASLLQRKKKEKSQRTSKKGKRGKERKKTHVVHLVLSSNQHNLPLLLTQNFLKRMLTHEGAMEKV